MSQTQTHWRAKLLPALFILSTSLATAESIDRPAVKVGDRWKYETRDGFSNQITAETERIITGISETRIEATENGSPATFSHEMNIIENPELRIEPTYAALKFPFEPGSKWSWGGTIYVKSTGTTLRNQYEVKVAGQERVAVKAGSFDTYKFVMEGYISTDTTRSYTRTYWYSPQARGFVKVINDDRRNAWKMELLEISLQQ